MILDIIKTILVALWIMLPAYLANPSAVIFGGGPPVDGGRYWKDGKRILGEGKTWNGLLGGTFAGMFIGWIQNFIVNVSGTTYLPPFDSYGSFYVIVLFSLSFGALFGDSAKSFVKRRMDIGRGQKSPYFMDQLDFVVGAWLFVTIFAGAWFWSTFTIPHALVVLILTPALHRIVNIIGYKMGKKDVPW